MAKSSRASRIKKNNQALKKRVFDPVETARNERLSAKLLELAKTSKEKEEEMQVEQEGNSESVTTSHASLDVDNGTGTLDTPVEEKDIDMDAASKPRKSNREIKRQNQARTARIEKKHKKPRNLRHFPSQSKRKGGKR